MKAIDHLLFGPPSLWSRDRMWRLPPDIQRLRSLVLEDVSVNHNRAYIELCTPEDPWPR